MIGRWRGWSGSGPKAREIGSAWSAGGSGPTRPPPRASWSSTPRPVLGLWHGLERCLKGRSLLAPVKSTRPESWTAQSACSFPPSVDTCFQHLNTTRAAASITAIRRMAKARCCGIAKVGWMLPVHSGSARYRRAGKPALGVRLAGRGCAPPSRIHRNRPKRPSAAEAGSNCARRISRIP